MRIRLSTPAQFCAGLASVLLFSSLVTAQYSGNVQGFVLDPSGATLAGASVTLRNVDTGVENSSKTSESGNYRFSSLPPGKYRVSALAGGFRQTEVTLTLETGQTQGIDIRVSVASTSSEVTVTTEAAALDIDENRVEATLSAATVRDLPSANRNLWDILAVTPGVVGTGTRGPGESPGGGADNFGTQTPQLSANGRSYTGNIVMVDGMNVTSPIQNGNIILAPVPDAVQEASLQANSWDAENSLGSSILIQVTTKSGTNQFHGTGSLFFNNQDLQAHSDFGPTVVPKFQRKDLVGALGGPIVKNKTFFFADFEKLWSKQPPVANTVFFEDPAFVQWAQSNFPNTVGTQIFGLYSGNHLVANGTVENAQTAFGASNCGSGSPTGIPCTLSALDQGNFSVSPYYNALQYNFRLDQYFTQKDRLYLSYYNDSFDQQQPSQRVGLQAFDIMRNRYGQADFTHTFSSNLLWESSFAFASVGGANGQDADLKVPEIFVNDNSQGFNIGGGWGPGEYRGPMYNWRSVVNMIRGAHSFKFGFNGGHGIEHGDFTPVNVRPNFRFNTYLDLVQDNPVQETVGAYNPLTGQAGSVVFGGQSTPFGFFGEDDWKVRPNFSLTLSLRWDDFTNHSPWGDSGFQFSSLILASGSNFQTQVANASVQPVSTVFANSQSNLWSPRIGFAWDPTKTGNWSVRGGIGVYHDWVVLGQSVDQMRNNPPGVLFECFSGSTLNGCNPAVTPIFALAPSGSYPFHFPLPTIGTVTFDSKGGNTALRPTVDALDRNLKAPYAVNYVIGVEHQLPWTLVAGASYSGSKGYNQLTGTNVNRCDGCGGTPLNPSFGSIDLVRNSNYSAYNAMLLTLRGRPTANLNFQTSYTFSHAKGNLESGTRFDQDNPQTGGVAGQNIPDLSAYSSYYADANYDVRQRLSLSGAYTLPGLSSGIGRVVTSGWELTSIVAVQSGTPFWVVCANATSCDYNVDGLLYDIPNKPATDFTGSHSRQQFKSGIFTQADFSVPTAGQEGNLPRNIYRNPGYLQIDASVLKNNHLPWIGEQGNLQFRFDFLNVLNRANLGPVDNNIADGSAFGTVHSALSGRQIQLGVRVSF
jgi:Carboxypeptidase regulatory-like domain/TonB dependent receptor-like, beta-barrel